MATYSWLTKTNAIIALQNRLNAGQFWSEDELFVYIQESLRTRNALCEEWREDFVLQAQGSQWINLGTTLGSPRLRTVTDSDLIIQMQMMLMEPPTGLGTWTGTNQFSLAKLQYALSNRRNEIIQAVVCNLANLAPISMGIGDRTTDLGDTVLQPRRVRFLALMATPFGSALLGGNVVIVTDMTAIVNGMEAVGAGIPTGTTVINAVSNAITLSLVTTAPLSNVQLYFYMPITLTREDTQSFQNFNTDYLQETGIPQSFSVANVMPLRFDVDRALSVPGEMDVIVLESGPAFGATPSLLGIPDDWSWLPMYGALADLLGEEAESTDEQRKEYCMKRYKDGLEMFMQANWLLQATVNNVARATPALAEKDRFLPEWETVQGQIPCVVQAGMDFVSAAPNVPQSISLTLVQNAPILDDSGTYVQISRDDWSSTLDLAQHIAMFKASGQEFKDTIILLDNFLKNCKQDNDRVITYGLDADVMFNQGQSQEKAEPR